MKLDIPSIQEAGAMGMQFPSQALTPSELEAFPEYGHQAIPLVRTNYIDVRNHILLLWVNDVQKELRLEQDVIDPLMEKYGSVEPVTGRC